MADDAIRAQSNSALPACGPTPFVKPPRLSEAWDYDFGDGWEHDVVVEPIEPARSDVMYPVCLTGKRACPPEDCGGPWPAR